MPARSCVVCIGAFYSGTPIEFAAANSVKAASAWLRSQGYRKRAPNSWGLLAYFENDAEMLWARVVAAPIVTGMEPQ